MRAEASDALERRLGQVLFVGARISTVLLAAGLLLVFAAGPAVALPVLRVGLFVLMLVPVTRVVVSVAGYAAAKDWAFVALSLVVLGVLVASFVTGLRR
jgi:uncharacterized membrane protein